MVDKRNFTQVFEDGTEKGVYIGAQPRQAALKLANRSEGTKDKPVIIRLRERGTKKIHVFKGWRELIKAPIGKPDWMPEEIRKPFVKKEKIERKD